MKTDISYLDEAFNEIDASLFSGDALHNRKGVAALKFWIERWSNKVIDIENDLHLNSVPDITAYLKDAYKVDDRIIGTIFNDARIRFQDGEEVTTSAVVKVSGNVVTTKNSVYFILNWKNDIVPRF